MRNSVSATGQRWGRRIADVTMSQLPTNLLALTLLVPSVSLDYESDPLLDEVMIVVYRCDRHSHLGWDQSFPVTLTFPGGRQFGVEIPPSHRLEDGHSFRVNVGQDTIVRERSRQTNRAIPRIVFNLSAPLIKQQLSMSRRLLESVREWNELMQCTSLYFVVEDDAARREVENSGIENFLEAYDTVRPGAFKADLMRYYLLYRYGGIYLDDKTFWRHSLDSVGFDSIFGGDGGTSSRPCDLFIGVSSYPEIAFIGARRGSPIILKALESSISNIMARLYPSHRLGVTGNIMFREMLAKSPRIIEPNINSSIIENSPIRISTETAAQIGAVWKNYWNENVALLPIDSSDERIMIGRDVLWQRQTIPSCDWPRPATYYNTLWNERKIYTDGNPSPTAWNRLMMILHKSPEVFGAILTIAVLSLIGFIISRYPPIDWI